MLFSKNPFDELVKKYSQMEIIKDKTVFDSKDQELSECFVFFVKCQYDLILLKKLYKEYYLPVAEKAEMDSRKSIEESMFMVNKGQMDEIDYHKDSIRWGYVVLFHRYETFINGVVKLFDKVWNDEGTTKVSKYLESEYQVNLKKIHLSEEEALTLFHIQFLCNSMKHNAGKPLKTKNEYVLPLLYPVVSMNENIIVEESKFLEHIDYMSSLYQVIFRLLTVTTLKLRVLNPALLNKVMLQEQSDKVLGLFDEQIKRDIDFIKMM